MDRLPSYKFGGGDSPVSSDYRRIREECYPAPQSKANESAETIKTLLSENAKLRSEVAWLNEELLEWRGYHPPQVGIWKEVGPPKNWNNPIL